MLYLIFSDIHSNLPAWDAFLKEIKKYKPDKIICLGDVVGYGPFPNECVEAVNILPGLLIVAGNHDYAAAGRFNLSLLNPLARQAVVWTKDRLTLNNINFLNNLPLVLEDSGFCFVHGSLFLPEEFFYLNSEKNIAENFLIMKSRCRICFSGHTHIPAIYSQRPKGIVRDYSSKALLKPAFKYIVNAGSIGQPRDRDSRGCFCLFDSEKMTVEFVRFSYNIGKTQKAILQSGLPLLLAQRLKQGW